MGTRSATGIINVKMEGTIKNVLDADSTGSPKITLGESLALTLATGTSANQFDRMWSDKGRALADTVSEDIDVYDFGSLDVGAGAGLDALGQSMALAEIVGVLAYNQSGSTGNLLFGGKATTAAWNSIFNSDDDAKTVIFPGGFNMFYAPTDPAYAVADTTNHILTCQATGGAITYDLHILGRSA